MKQTFKTPLNFKEVPVGTLEDNVLVRTPEGDVKKIPASLLGGGAGVEIKGEYASNEDAKANGLVAGDFYSTPLNNQTAEGNKSFIAIVRDMPPIGFELEFADIDATMVNLGIADKTNIADWNTYLGFEGEGYGSVSISGNKATLTKNNFQIDESVYFENMELIGVEVLDAKVKFSLYLGGNNIVNFNPAVVYPAGISLSLQNNGIAEFNPDLSFNFDYLDLSMNAITEFNPDNSQNIAFLRITNNNLTTFNPAHVSGIRGLVLDYNNITEFDFNTYLSYLSMIGNLLTEFNPSNIYYGLESLDLSENQIENFDPFNIFPKLSSLVLTQNPMTSFNPLNRSFPELKYLRVSNMPLLTSFDPVNIWKYSPLLEEVHVYACSLLTVFNPTVAIESKKLVRLALFGNSLTEFNPNFELPSTLMELNIGDNELTKFNPTIALPIDLQYLDISNNNIGTSAWNTETAWIDSRPNKRNLRAFTNTNSIVGTTSESLLLAKNWTIEP